jgi:outer membrane protein TolC
LFHSKALDALIERSLKANPYVNAAQTALLIARKNVYTPQVSVSFVPDIFGLNRRTVESLQAQEQQTRFAQAATHITLNKYVAAGAIEEVTVRAQIDATRELITINTNMLEILRTQYATGYASKLEVVAQKSQLMQVAATLPPLLKQLAQQRDLLALLSGLSPNQELTERFELSSLQLPQELPVSTFSQHVEKRPDVRQAEENLHSASAQIGIATANRLPSFALTADAGSMAVTFGSMFAGGTGFWDLGASVGGTVPTSLGTRPKADWEVTSRKTIEIEYE